MRKIVDEIYIGDRVRIARGFINSYRRIPEFLKNSIWTVVGIESINGRLLIYLTTKVEGSYYMASIEVDINETALKLFIDPVSTRKYGYRDSVCSRRDRECPFKEFSGECLGDSCFLYSSRGNINRSLIHIGDCIRVPDRSLKHKYYVHGIYSSSWPLSLFLKSDIPSVIKSSRRDNKLIVGVIDHDCSKYYKKGDGSYRVGLLIREGSYGIKFNFDKDFYKSFIVNNSEVYLLSGRDDFEDIKEDLCESCIFDKEFCKKCIFNKEQGETYD